METLPEDIFHHIALPLGTRFRLGRVSKTLREKICRTTKVVVSISFFVDASEDSFLLALPASQINVAQSHLSSGRFRTLKNPEVSGTPVTIQQQFRNHFTKLASSRFNMGSAAVNIVISLGTQSNVRTVLVDLKRFAEENNLVISLPDEESVEKPTNYLKQQQHTSEQTSISRWPTQVERIRYHFHDAVKFSGRSVFPKSLWDAFPPQTLIFQMNRMDFALLERRIRSSRATGTVDDVLVGNDSLICFERNGRFPFNTLRKLRVLRVDMTGSDDASWLGRSLDYPDCPIEVLDMNSGVITPEMATIPPRLRELTTLVRLENNMDALGSVLHHPHLKILRDLPLFEAAMIIHADACSDISTLYCSEHILFESPYMADCMQEIETQVHMPLDVVATCFPKLELIQLVLSFEYTLGEVPMVEEDFDDFDGSKIVGEIQERWTKVWPGFTVAVIH